MAIGKASDFTIYQDEMRGAIVERLTQSSDHFNTAGGAIRLSTISRRGEYAKESFFANIANLVTRRDTTSVSAATDLASTMEEIISVKVNRKVGPLAQTLDAFRKVQMSAGEDSLSFLIGTQIAKAMEVDMLDSALRTGVAALANQANVTHDISAESPSNTITTDDLVQGLAKFGDAGQNVTAWVMHSKVWYDLMRHQIGTSANGDIVAGVTLQQGSPLTLNRPVIVTDSTALIDDQSPDDFYYTMGLTANGLVVENSEEETMATDLVTGLENLVVRLQGEFAYNLGVKGFKWDTANGGANPNDAALGTGSNWDAAFQSHKDYAGVLVKSGAVSG
jgi:hypothetical protein